MALRVPPHLRACASHWYRRRRPRSCPAPARRPETKCKPVSTGGRVSSFGLQLSFWRRRHGAAGFLRGDGNGRVGDCAGVRPREGRREARAARERALPSRTGGRGYGRLRGTAPPTRSVRAAPPCPAHACGACAAASATYIFWAVGGER